MKKIVIIGANDFQNQLILKAKEMGFETHVFAWQDGSIGERTADYFYPHTERRLTGRIFWKNAERSNRMQWQPSHRILRILPSAKWQQA